MGNDGILDSGNDGISRKRHDAGRSYALKAEIPNGDGKLRANFEHEEGATLFTAQASQGNNDPAALPHADCPQPQGEHETSRRLSGK